MPNSTNGRRVGYSSVILTAGLLIICGVPVSLAGEETWEIILKQQLLTEQNCQFGEWLRLKKIPIGNDLGIDGRVRCQDGRQFDITREKSHQKFEIRACMPTVC